MLEEKKKKKSLSNEQVSQPEAVPEWPSRLWRTLPLPRTHLPQLLSHLQQTCPSSATANPSKAPWAPAAISPQLTDQNL